MKSPQGSPESKSDILFELLAALPDIELGAEASNGGMAGAGAFKLKSPSKSTFDTLGAVAAAFSPPVKGQYQICLLGQVRHKVQLKLGLLEL